MERSTEDQPTDPSRRRYLQFLALSTANFALGGCSAQAAAISEKERELQNQDLLNKVEIPGYKSSQFYIYNGNLVIKFARVGNFTHPHARSAPLLQGDEGFPSNIIDLYINNIPTNKNIPNQPRIDGSSAIIKNPIIVNGGSIDHKSTPSFWLMSDNLIKSYSSNDNLDIAVRCFILLETDDYSTQNAMAWDPIFNRENFLSLDDRNWVYNPTTRMHILRSQIDVVSTTR